MKDLLSFRAIKIAVVLSLFAFLPQATLAQNDLASLQQSADSYNTYRTAQLKAHRTFTKNRNPLKFVSNSVLWVYQRVFSEQIMAECGFEPSCSAYAKQAISERGVFTGVLLAVDRLTRCNGVAQPESENYLVNKKTGKLRDEPGMYKIGK